MNPWKKHDKSYETIIQLLTHSQRRLIFNSISGKALKDSGKHFQKLLYQVPENKKS